MSKADFSCFRNGSYLNGKYCAGYAVSTPFDVTEVASLPLATIAQQAHTGLHLAKGITLDISTDSRDAFGVVQDLERCGSNMAFLLPAEIKFKMVHRFRSHWMLYFYLLL